MTSLTDGVLRTRSLAVHHGPRIAVRDVDLDVSAGERIAVVGRNGAGKSSLLGALAGIVAHHGVLDWSLQPGQVAYVPQRADPRWDLPLDVRQVVATGCLRAGRWWRRPDVVDAACVDAALERLGLLDLARRRVGGLSGGQAQRVLLARALAQRPRALLLDEPYDGLDRVGASLLAQLLEDLAADGVAVLAAVHDLGVVRSGYDRVLGIDGRVVVDGSPSDVLTPDGLCALFGLGRAA